MALTHLNGTSNLASGRIYFTACGRRTQSLMGKYTRATNEENFIEGYVKYRGKDYCSKCALRLIEKRKLVAAENTITDSEKQLIEKLTKGTKILHDNYIVATKEFAKRSFANFERQLAWTLVEWYEQYGIEMEVYYSNQYHQSVKADHPEAIKRERVLRNKAYYSMYNKKEAVGKIVKAGFEVYEEKEIAAAERHYNDSIGKLAYRIREKSMNTDKMKVTSAAIKNNGIDTIITDGTNSVHAWTIIAEGPIQRPHYRYLVK